MSSWPWGRFLAWTLSLLSPSASIPLSLFFLLSSPVHFLYPNQSTTPQPPWKVKVRLLVRRLGSITQDLASSLGPWEAHSGHGQGGWEKCRKRSPLPGPPSWGLPLGSLGVSPESQRPESVSQSIEFWFHSSLISLFLCPHPQLGLQLKAMGTAGKGLGVRIWAAH